MAKVKKELVLVAAWFINDDWYGKRFRAIVRPAVGETFATKTEANKHKAALKKYVKRNFPDAKVAAADMTASDPVKLLTYEHVSMGPSISYKHYELTIEEINAPVPEEDTFY